MQEKILLEKFNLWTKSSSPERARIEIFNQIRDIPYYLVPALPDPREWAASILTVNRASCSPKHYLMGMLFAKLEIPIKYATYPFKWGEQKLNYPAELLKLAQRSPIVYHVACRAWLENKWVLLDASWDIGLKKAGFTVNENWDGFSDTVNSVTPLDEIIHESLEERLEFVEEKKALYTEEQKLVYGRFIEGINTWLEGLRK